MLAVEFFSDVIFVVFIILFYFLFSDCSLSTYRAAATGSPKVHDAVSAGGLHSSSLLISSHLIELRVSLCLTISFDLLLIYLFIYLFLLLQ